jgi:putative flippase GtrA
VLTSVRAAVTYARSDLGRKAVRYVMTSVVGVVVSLTVGIFCQRVLGMRWLWAQVCANLAATPPSYFLNRMWVWQRKDRSSIWREVVPFWTIAIVQFFISVWFVGQSEGWVNKLTSNDNLRTAGFAFSSLFIYGIMWVGKFILFNRVLFAHKHVAEAAPLAVTEGA